jgi:hypothetical protein
MAFRLIFSLCSRLPDSSASKNSRILNLQLSYQASISSLMKLKTVFFFFLFPLLTSAQSPLPRPLKVLFIGNSYTYYNHLPQLCAGIAASMSDVLITDQSTVGGYTLRQHVANANTQARIQEGTPDYTQSKARSSWDYVVLQEHSQLPSNPIETVEKDVFPYVHSLDSIIHVYNPDSKLIMYCTWGRKNGDASRCPDWPAVCTYTGMDSLLALRYAQMARVHHALLSPVGAVWKYIRDTYPAIELYTQDESHPSEAGSYAAACCFYTVLFKKDPALIPYNYTLSSSDAARIREAVKKVVYNHLDTP